MTRWAVAAEPDRRNAARNRDTDRARVAARWNQPSRAKSSEPVEESEEWVISYMDMVTVLMTVFLGMLSILGMDGRLSVSDDAERAAAAHVEQELQQTLPPPAPPASPPLQQAAAPEIPAPPPLSPAARQWLARLEALGLPPEVDISSGERKVTIVVRDRILFSSGSATLQPAALDLLRRLTPSLASLPGSIIVEGHTDDLAISTARFPSNWELSAARAAAVVRALAAMGIPPGRLGALGLADSRPLTGDTARRAENRRVEIVVDTDAATAHSATR